MPFNNNKSRRGYIKGSTLDKSNSPLKQYSIAGKLATGEIKAQAAEKGITQLGKKLGLKQLAGKAIAPMSMLLSVKDVKEAMHKDKTTPKWVTGSSWQDKTDIKIKDTRPNFLKGSWEEKQ